MALREAGRWDLAIELFEQTLSAQTAKLGVDHPYTLLTQNNLGPAYQAIGQVERAVALLEWTLAARVAKLGADHPRTLSRQNNLALAYQDGGRLDLAIPMFEQTLAARVAKHGVDHPRTLTTQFDLAAAHAATGDTARAEPMLRQVIVARTKKLGAGHPDVAQALSALGAGLLRQRRWAEAEPLLREGLAIRDSKRPDDWARFETRSLLGDSLLGRRKYAEAEPLLVSGYEEMKARESKIPAPSRIRLTEAGRRVVRLYEAWGKPGRAAAWRAARSVISTCRPMCSVGRDRERPGAVRRVLSEQRGAGGCPGRRRKGNRLETSLCEATGTPTRAEPAASPLAPSGPAAMCSSSPRNAMSGWVCCGIPRRVWRADRRPWRNPPGRDALESSAAARENGRDNLLPS